MSIIDDKLSELKEMTGTSRNVDLAKVLGVSTSTIQTWRYRGKIPEDIFLKAEQVALHGSVTPRGYVSIKLYEVEASAGSGSLVENEDPSTDLLFSEKYLRKDLGYKPENVFLLSVRGDSMAPTLKNQSMVMVNKIDDFASDGVYVFRFEGALLVKRLQFLPEGIEVVSDNPTYKTWEISKKDLEHKDFQIIGEVVWSGQRM
ncbi:MULTISPECIES: LexA family transcriptional regulator [Vibrio]|uniref:Peptidase S24 LexA-like protein n=2 Tax=Vibrio crassostreae TaxID=246167 RepID=A0A4V2RRR1_9VIBR|nr:MULTISPECIES: S24 family peptidase [Vibrio]MDH5952386.1 helix-turn-helix domain-containing protein [Vibrio crassostreae]TCN02794.1 bacteriophage CI repressor-like protein [Vibrio crassostreae]TCN80802.1 bacteriophage CI repressor-like protein [Vibrio crassostreae]TCO01492.1 bacteriophage CI repressor-like protein [Vibrio crassostreae]TCT51262.1 bacteriophage CI repressor-like protein [Vibrio crassostreae]